MLSLNDLQQFRHASDPQILASPIPGTYYTTAAYNPCPNDARQHMLHNAYQVLRSDGDMQGSEGGKRAADGRCLGLGRLRRAAGTVTGPGELLLGASDVG